MDMIHAVQVVPISGDRSTLAKLQKTDIKLQKDLRCGEFTVTILQSRQQLQYQIATNIKFYWLTNQLDQWSPDRLTDQLTSG